MSCKNLAFHIQQAKRKKSFDPTLDEEVAIGSQEADRNRCRYLQAYFANALAVDYVDHPVGDFRL